MLLAIPPFLTAVLATVPIVLGVLLIVAPLVLPPWLKYLDEKTRERLLGATKAAFLILSSVAPSTPTTIDDEIAKLIRIVERELEKSLTSKQKKFVANAVLSMQADPTKVSLKNENGSALSLETSAAVRAIVDDVA